MRLEVVGHPLGISLSVFETIEESPKSIGEPFRQYLKCSGNTLENARIIFESVFAFMSQVCSYFIFSENKGGSEIVPIVEY